MDSRFELAHRYVPKMKYAERFGLAAVLTITGRCSGSDPESKEGALIESAYEIRRRF